MASEQVNQGARAAPPGTQVVQRVAAILKAFSPEHPEWKLRELALALGLAKSTAHRLLLALESEDFVAYDPASGVFRLGPSSAAMGLQALHSRDLRALALPVLELLARESQETCTLEMLVGRQVLIASEVTGGHLIHASGNVGTRWPLHATSSGKAILAAMVPSRRSSVLELPLVAFTALTTIQPGRLSEELDHALDVGFATTIDELEVGYSASSAAILAGAGEPVAALSLGGPSSRLEPERLEQLGKLLSKSAADLSALLCPAA